MTGSDEDTTPKVIEPPSLKSKQFSSTANNEQNTQFNTTKTSTTATGNTRYQRDGTLSAWDDNKSDDVLVDNRSSNNSSPRSDVRSSRSSQQIPRSRSSSLDGDIDSSRRGGVHFRNPVGTVSTDVDKSVTSSVIIDEEHANLCLNDEELELISKDEVITLYHRLQHYIVDLKRKQQDELRQAHEIEAKLRAERTELSRREKVLIMRLTTRERQLIESGKEASVLKSSIVPNLGALRSTLLDPAVNLIIQKFKKDLAETKKKLEDTQNDLNAWKFTPDSNTGKRLMAKCRMLYLENEDLGKQTSSGRVAKLENDLALNKQLVTEMKQSQEEMDEVVQELDEDIEGLQSAIQHLQQELRCANERHGTGSDNFSVTNELPLKTELNPPNSEFITLSLSVLCAQCRLNHATNMPGTKKRPESTALRTRRPPFANVCEDHEPTSIEHSHGLQFLGVTRAQYDERTSPVNGELLLESKSHPYSQSVQNVVNSSNSNSPRTSPTKREDDGEIRSSSSDDGLFECPPSTKRTKFIVKPQGGDYETNRQSLECHSSSSFNGNGSVNDH